MADKSETHLFRRTSIKLQKEMRFGGQWGQWVKWVDVWEEVLWHQTQHMESLSERAEVAALILAGSIRSRCSHFTAGPAPPTSYVPKSKNKDRRRQPPLFHLNEVAKRACWQKNSSLMYYKALCCVLVSKIPSNSWICSSNWTLALALSVLEHI